MKNIKLLLAYEGTHLLGWQKTPLGPTVEEHLETILSQILQEPISLQAASRTDAGVYAEGQVVNFLTQKEVLDLEKLQKSLNALLPSQIRVCHIEEMPLSFHPTLDNLGKEYHYFLCNTSVQQPKHRLFSWQFPYPLDVDAMNLASLHFLGTHDFSTFCNERSLSQKDPICTLSSLKIVPLDDSRLCFQIQGNRFLFRMVRNLVGTLAYIGCGKIPLSAVPALLKSLRRETAGMTAPSHGLHLIRVFYQKTAQNTKLSQLSQFHILSDT